MYLQILVSMTCATLVSGMDLQCYNDYDKTMDCHFSSVKSSCSEYNLELKPSDLNDPYRPSCILKKIMRSSDVICSCSISMRYLIIAEEFTATLRNQSFTIRVVDSIKPKRPKITEVKQSPNGNFWVTWKKNYEKPFADELKTELTYKKTGDIDGVSQNTSSTIFEILGTNLERNTKYVLIIRTYFSPHFSDSSEEWHFTTPEGSSRVFKIVIVALSIVAISLTCILFWCFIRLKKKCWDTVPKYLSPALLKMDSKEPWILSPSKTPLCPISVDYLKMNGTEGKQLSIQDGSGQSQEYESEAVHDFSSQSYALTCPPPINDLTPCNGQKQIAKIQAELFRVFPNLSVISVDPSKSQSYMNVPNSKPMNNLESVMEIPTLVTMGHALPCDGSYNSNEIEITFPQIFLGTNQDPPWSPLEEDSSYHPCTNGFVSSSPVEDISLTCKTTEHNIPTPTCSLSPSGDDYQALQSLQQHNSCQWTVSHCAEQDRQCPESKHLQSSETMPLKLICNSQEGLFFSMSTFPDKVEQIDDYHCV